MSSTWDNCLARLENEVASSDFSTWIRPLQAVENETQLILFAPNRFVLDWVQKHFFTQLAATVAEFSNNHLQLSVEVGSKNAYTFSSTKPSIISEPEVNPSNANFLNKLFTFDNFIEGKSNQLARAASVQVAENSGKIFNPLLIYGSSGLGKTHLMQATGHAILQKNALTRLVYLHTEKFVQDMVRAFQQNTIDTFKNYYRAVDVLLVDDIQFLAGKDRSQEEFFHTFNFLLEKKCQVIFTCDRYPKEIIGLEERLKTRLSAGLPVSIEPPDIETRAAILIKKASLAQVVLPSDVAFFIAKHIPFNVRELEGALRRVIANAQFTGQTITVTFAKDALHDLITIQDKLINIDSIQKTVADYFKLRVPDLLAQNRKQIIARPRQIAMALARDLTTHSLPEIGLAFGGRDHTTVMNACKRVQELKRSDKKIAEDYEILSQLLKQ